jgi:PelA/Pel-15E family pectate lyase
MEGRSRHPGAATSVEPLLDPRSPGDRLVDSSGRFKQCRLWLVPKSLALGLFLAAACVAATDRSDLAQNARDTLVRATAYFRNELAVQGSYGWRYSADLTYRHGDEVLITASQGWVEPPGTSAVGLALMQAYTATGDRFFLEGAVEAARALAVTQLESGGWQPLIEFDPERRKAWCYRLTPSDQVDRKARSDNELCDATTIDNNISQSALELLMRVDIALDGDDPLVRDASAYALEKLIEAQYPNGAWPVRFDLRVPTSRGWATRSARYPDTWTRTPVKTTDLLFYAINDNTIGDLIRVLIMAHRLYGRDEYLGTAIRAGDFLLAAQMPEPQPGWAQQYNRDLEPIWGRRFEPPAIASWETRGAVDALLLLYVHTRKTPYVEAAGRAVAWLEESRLPDNRWARFYELRTNHPLYMTSDYLLTYDDGDTPRHYSFEGGFGIPDTLESYGRLAHGEVMIPASSGGGEWVQALVAELAPQVQDVVASLDERGRWLEDGMVSSETFVANVDLLARYVAATQGKVLPRLALLDR